MCPQLCLLASSCPHECCISNWYGLVLLTNCTYFMRCTPFEMNADCDIGKIICCVKCISFRHLRIAALFCWLPRTNRTSCKPQFQSFHFWEILYISWDIFNLFLMKYVRMWAISVWKSSHVWGCEEEKQSWFSSIDQAGPLSCFALRFYHWLSSATWAEQPL